MLLIGLSNNVSDKNQATFLLQTFQRHIHYKLLQSQVLITETMLYNNYCMTPAKCKYANTNKCNVICVPKMKFCLYKL